MGEGNNKDNNNDNDNKDNNDNKNKIKGKKGSRNHSKITVVAVGRYNSVVTSYEKGDMVTFETIPLKNWGSLYNFTIKNLDLEDVLNNLVEDAGYNRIGDILETTIEDMEARIDDVISEIYDDDKNRSPFPKYTAFDIASRVADAMLKKFAYLVPMKEEKKEMMSRMNVRVYAQRREAALADLIKSRNSELDIQEQIIGDIEQESKWYKKHYNNLYAGLEEVLAENRKLESELMKHISEEDGKKLAKKEQRMRQKWGVNGFGWDFDEKYQNGCDAILSATQGHGALTPDTKPRPWDSVSNDNRKNVQGRRGLFDHEENPQDYLINYNEKFKDDDPVLFRDSVVEQTLSCLIGRNKPNALLIGAAGVGKTKIVENIAWRLANNEQSIPEQLRGYTIWELPISNLVNDSGIVGDVERKTKSVLEYAANPDNKVILFIDEIHILVEIRGGSNSYLKIAQIMKPFLARGDMRVIGATTLQESKNLMHDPAFNRRFTRLIVDELSPSQTIEILKTMQDVMVEHYHHRILLGDSVIEDIVKIADEYKTIGSHRPDNALTLLDRSMADAYINYLKKLENENKTVDDIPTIELGIGQMRKTAMRIMTGNNEKVEVSKEALRKSLQIIKGQDEAKDYLLDAIERDNLNVYPRIKPLTILFAGSSGVGKTEVSKILARELTSLEPIILNMTEYNDAASIARIVGAPPGYIGFDSKAELPFDILESNPYQVILLDEFEKADRSVQRLFMSVFDEGYIKTSKGTHVDFTKSIIIATTNAGYTERKESIGFAKVDSETTGASVSDLSKYFDIELLNRFTKILNFNSITRELYEEIMRDTYRRQIKQVKETKPEYGFMPDELSDDDLNKMVEETYSQEFGARPVSPTVQKYIEDNIIRWQSENS